MNRRAARFGARVVAAGVFVAALALHGCGGLPDGSDRGSQPAEVRQRMGSTEIALVYNRPSARGRELFGGLVPFDSIWTRARTRQPGSSSVMTC